MTTVTVSLLAAACALGERAIKKRMQRLRILSRKSGRQHKLIFALSDLPDDMQRAVLKHLSPPSPPQSPQSATPAPAAAGPALRDWQRARMDARLALLAEVDRLSVAGGRELAIRTLIGMASKGELPVHLQKRVASANARAGGEGKRTLSRATIRRWLALRDAGALAPRETRAQAPLPPWAAALLEQYRRPQKPSLTAALELLVLPAGVAPPSYHQARRFLGSVSTVERNRGRLGPRALKSLKPYVKRDVSDLDPLDVIQMDGHQADFEVAHPAHGGPLRPEITTVIDVRTRRIVGWSAGLAESAHAVMDALRHAAERAGVAAILYVDKGSGYEAAVMSDEVIGLLARLGTRHESSLPYNSQARGQIERLHRSVWVRAGKTLPSYVGADMDKEAAGKVHKLTRRDLAGRGRALLMPWPEFIAWAQDVVDAYNARLHRGLARIADPALGRMRHLSPDEAWCCAIEAGFEPVRVSEAEALDLFRPHREVTTRRGLVQLFGNSYFNEALQHFGGERVVVAYDMHDPARVWVKALDGRLICTAEWDANKRAMFPMAVVDQARQKRAEGRERRLAVHLEEVRAELTPTLEVVPAPADLTPEQLAASDAQLARLELPAPAAAPPDGRPFFRSDDEYVAWIKANPEKLTDDDRAWLAERSQSWNFRVLHGLEEPSAAAG